MERDRLFIGNLFSGYISFKVMSFWKCLLVKGRIYQVEWMDFPLDSPQKSTPELMNTQLPCF